MEINHCFCVKGQNVSSLELLYHPPWCGFAVLPTSAYVCAHVYVQLSKDKNRPKLKMSSYFELHVHKYTLEVITKTTKGVSVCLFIHISEFVCTNWCKIWKVVCKSSRWIVFPKKPTFIFANVNYYMFCVYFFPVHLTCTPSYSNLNFLNLVNLHIRTCKSET